MIEHYVDPALLAESERLWEEVISLGQQSLEFARQASRRADEARELDAKIRHQLAEARR